jgi:hypothetical protein
VSKLRRHQEVVVQDQEGAVAEKLTPTRNLFRHLLVTRKPLHQSPPCLDGKKNLQLVIHRRTHRNSQIARAIHILLVIRIHRVRLVCLGIHRASKHHRIRKIFKGVVHLNRQLNVLTLKQIVNLVIHILLLMDYREALDQLATLKVVASQDQLAILKEVVIQDQQAIPKEVAIQDQPVIRKEVVTQDQQAIPKEVVSRDLVLYQLVVLVSAIHRQMEHRQVLE